MCWCGGGGVGGSIKMRKYATRGKGEDHINANVRIKRFFSIQFRIQKKLGDNVFSWGSGLLPQYQQYFIDLHYFTHF